MGSESGLPPFLDRALDSGHVELLRKIGAAAASAGERAYLVGGLVRDLFLGVGAVDLDIAVEGDGLSFARRLGGELGAVVTEHDRFLTCTLLLPDGARIDVATARAETYSRPGALPDVKPAGIFQDMARRDFTINAMALEVNPDKFGELVDPHGGATDLGRGVIRVLHEGSFVDDPTRVLRMARFAARFGFAVETSTRRLVAAAVRGGAFDRLSGDRLREELALFFGESEPAKAFLRLGSWRVLESVLPGVRIGRGLGRRFEQARRLISVVERGAEWNTVTLDFLLFLLGVRRQALNRVMDRLDMKGATRRSIGYAAGLKELAGRTDGARKMSEVNSVLGDVPLEVVLAVAVVSKSARSRRRVIEYLRHGRGVRPELSGHDLLEMGFEEGPGLKLILETLVRAKIDGEVSTRRQEEALVRERFSPPDGRARGSGSSRIRER